MKVELLKGWAGRPKGTQMDVGSGQAKAMLENKIAKQVEEKPKRTMRIGRSLHVDGYSRS